MALSWRARLGRRDTASASREGTGAGAWITEAVRQEAQKVLAQRLQWVDAVGYDELARHVDHNLAAEVLGPVSRRKYAHETDFWWDAPANSSTVRIVIDVYAYDDAGAWSATLAQATLLVDPDGSVAGTTRPPTP